MADILDHCKLCSAKAKAFLRWRCFSNKCAFDEGLCRSAWCHWARTQRAYRLQRQLPLNKSAPEFMAFWIQSGAISECDQDSWINGVTSQNSEYRLQVYSAWISSNRASKAIS